MIENAASRGDNLFGETTYLVNSLVAKFALAWQIFRGSLAN